MTLLAELFEQLEAGLEEGEQRQTVAQVGVVAAATLAPAINDHQTAPDPSQAMTASPAVPIPAPAAERPAEARRNAWTITRGSKPVCTICGAPMTRDEALAEARWRWPDADIE